jgi:hypothetical protein
MATAKQGKPWMRLCASVLTGLALSAFGLVGSISAHATPPPGNHWCPGDPWNPAWGTVYDWDWNRCHDWQGQAGQSGPAGAGPWGPTPVWATPKPPPPPWAPGAQLMWNWTRNGWGFWNNATWIPI